MESVHRERRSVNGRAALDELMEQASQALEQAIAQRLNKWLQSAVTALLGRQRHVRRHQVPHWFEQTGYCMRCKSHESRRFSRNGSRRRILLIDGFAVQIRLPRLKCVCGGSVRLDFGGLLRPCQRLDDRVDAQIKRWARCGSVYARCKGS